jgi:uncharacterized protein (TIGR00251 family)
VNFAQATPEGVVMQVKVVPNSSRNQVVGVLGTALKIKVAAPPEAGRANAAVCELIADKLDVAPQNITVVAGHTQALKRIAIRGVDLARVLALATR